MTEVSRKNKLGLEEIINTETGQVVAVQKPNKSQLQKIEEGKTYKGPMVKQGANARFEYTQEMVDLLCEMIAEGKTIKQISKIPGMPSTPTIYSWMRKYKEFKTYIQQARKDRAEYFHDKVIELADTTTNDNVRPNKLRVEAYKWAASVGSPEQYQPKAQEGSKGNVTFIINTGVELEEKPLEVKAEWKSEQSPPGTSQESSLKSKNSTNDSSDSTS